MQSTGNKVPLINVISKYLIEKLENANYRNIFRRYSYLRRKRCCVQENRSKKCTQEADINIIKQQMVCVKLEVKCEKVICDNTDAFALLTVYVFWQGGKLKNPIKAFFTSQSLININETVTNYAKIPPSLIYASARSGCDYVPKLFCT